MQLTTRQGYASPAGSPARKTITACEAGQKDRPNPFQFPEAVEAFPWRNAASRVIRTG